jgi:hypothetical protein
LRPPLKTSQTLAKWITRTQRFALRAFGQYTLKLRPVSALIPNALNMIPLLNKSAYIWSKLCQL